MSIRFPLASGLATTIAKLEDCDPLKADTIAAIERTLSDYATARLSDLRQSVQAQTWSAREKQHALTLIDAALHEERA